MRETYKQLPGKRYHCMLETNSQLNKELMCVRLKKPYWVNANNLNVGWQMRQTRARYRAKSVAQYRLARPWSFKPASGGLRSVGSILQVMVLESFSWMIARSFIRKYRVEDHVPLWPDACLIGPYLGGHKGVLPKTVTPFTLAPSLCYMSPFISLSALPRMTLKPIKFSLTAVPIIHALLVAQLH
ncbi:hypothetical protein AG1IA_01974 [Rhizoctonia solani AG-1 IA]|uniref:Uncharacterized protein n=1 Tax=Thanatephorus cucumeris (strain AG1-IA) TaxID=983506 RepID=L8X4N7_THACA|nr:hypothetical protein AG1IA_01974 [Rhizoctonia solani AG-1 IA]